MKIWNLKLYHNHKHHPFLPLHKLHKLKTQIQSTSTPTASQAPNGVLANWETYTDPKGKYYFKYPTDWTASKDVGLLNDPTMKFILDLQAKDTTLSAQDWANANVCTKFATPTDQNGCTTYASGPINNSIQFTFLAHYGAMHTVFKNGNTIFDVTVDAREPNPNFEDIKGVYDQILSTFKFIDRSDAEGKFCGGIAANLPENQCPEGFSCKLDGKYPNAGGVCVKN